VSALYWKPVYRFIRVKFRKNNEDAKDLTPSLSAIAFAADFCVFRSGEINNSPFGAGTDHHSSPGLRSVPV